MRPVEVERIAWLRRLTGGSAPARGGGRLLLGIGDDAALLVPPSGSAVVLTVDAQVEGVHFRRAWMSPRGIGARAVAAAASDLAAMAALPSGILLAFTLPAGTPERFFRELYRGALAEARRVGLAVMGGNLAAGPLSITVTAVGAVPPREAVPRGGARAGDGIYVTGRPGLAALGRTLLASRGRRAEVRVPGARTCLRAFRAPRPRLREGRFIARRLRPRAMIDLSDGLGPDLERLLDEARARGEALGAELDGERISALLGQQGAALAARLKADLLSIALTGGEDYELLFTAPPGRPERAAAAFRSAFGLPLTRVGTVVRRPGIRLAGSTQPLRLEAFEHFA